MLEMSFSRISLLLKCPRQFEFRYLKDIPVPRPGALFLGGTAHHTLSENSRFKIDSREDMPLERFLEVFSDAWEKQSYFEDETPGEIDWQGENPGYVKDVGVEILRCYHRELAPKVMPLAVELPLEKTLDNVLLRGRIDLIKDSGTPVDLKTAKRRRSQDELDRDLQPTIYTLLLGGPSPFEFHLLLKTKVPGVEVSLTRRTQEDIDWFLRELLPRAAAQIEAGIFPPNPTGWWCGKDWCSFYDICGRPRGFST